MNINGKTAELQFDFGMARQFKERSGKDLLSMKESEYQDIDVMHSLVYSAAVRGNPDITLEDVDCIKFSEMESVVNEIKAGMTKLKGDKKNAKSRQG